MNFTEINPQYGEIRRGVARVCMQFAGEYWRKCDAEKRYPEEFVSALTKEGFLAAMIPEKYGGAGLDLAAAAVILEEIHRHGCNAAACHAQMYTMGTSGFWKMELLTQESASSSAVPSEKTKVSSFR